ncbi:LacI family DNA-binding transcriptional regulator [Agromyces sp. G08B096]|uniref:LacI family DNA-binding transcriptional regulator n=1 Tax=Agromyces sp. G08B096 TaxID=3156399 RepID=A0AAU7WDF6_9MICO
MTNTSPGRAATIEDVAREAGVSRAAVSKVIRNAYGVSPAMRERVTAAIDKLQYRPRHAARAMRGSSFTLGIEIPEFGNQFFTRVLTGATRALEGTGYQLIIAPAEPGSKWGYRALESLTDHQVDGIIAISPLVEPAWLERLATAIPVVMLGRHDEGAGYDTVTGDDRAGTDAVMDHLIELGHRRIAHLTIAESMIDPSLASPHAIRLATYLDRMTAAGLTEHAQVARVGADDDAHAAALDLLGGRDRPTAVFVGNDQPALGVLRARMELGLTAQDVSIAGYDDIELAAHPAISLTTVDQDGERMGERAIELLLERIKDGRSAPERYSVTPRLRVRGSTAPPRA